MMTQKNERKRISLKGIQTQFFRTQLVLIISLAIILGVAGTLINVHYETEKRDRNLQNVAQAIASSPMLLQSELTGVTDYLDTLKESLDDIDVISVVNKEGIRIYHSDHSLIGTKYDGNQPNFKEHSDGYYTVDENGPSGSQRRAYAAIYDKNGDLVGVVMAIMLTKNIKVETFQMLFIFLIVTVVAILIEIIIATELSGKVKKSLMGYEPDVFTSMYQMRDNILETLEEGILAVDNNGVIQFANEAAIRMLCDDEKKKSLERTLTLWVIWCFLTL